MTIKPEGDARYRVNRSELIWVMEERFSESGTHIYEIHGGKERTVYRIDGKSGEYVVFENRYRKLYSKEACKELISKAKSDEIYMFSNWLGVSPAEPKSLSQLEPAFFINVSE
jgi:hypothetical protein